MINRQYEERWMSWIKEIETVITATIKGTPAYIAIGLLFIAIGTIIVAIFTS